MIMKTFTSILFLLVSLQGFSQTELPIKFKVIKDAEVKVGKAWDYSYNQMKIPLNVEFDGKKLKMLYGTGRVFWEADIISYKRKEQKNYDKLEKEAFILKFEKEGFIKYLVIEKYYYSNGFAIYDIRIPQISIHGQTYSYHYYKSL